MSNTSNEPSQPVAAAPRRPGMLVEDRNAAVRTAPTGEQTIVKVASRTEEAARQGVRESQV